MQPSQVQLAFEETSTHAEPPLTPRNSPRKSTKDSQQSSLSAAAMTAMQEGLKQQHTQKGRQGQATFTLASVSPAILPASKKGKLKSILKKAISIQSALSPEELKEESAKESVRKTLLANTITTTNLVCFLLRTNLHVLQDDVSTELIENQAAFKNQQEELQEIVKEFSIEDHVLHNISTSVQNCLVLERGVEYIHRQPFENSQLVFNPIYIAPPIPHHCFTNVHDRSLVERLLAFDLIASNRLDLIASSTSGAIDLHAPTVDSDAYEDFCKHAMDTLQRRKVRFAENVSIWTEITPPRQTHSSPTPAVQLIDSADAKVENSLVFFDMDLDIDGHINLRRMKPQPDEENLDPDELPNMLWPTKPYM